MKEEILDVIDQTFEKLASKPKRQGILPSDNRERLLTLGAAAVGAAGTYLGVRAWNRWGGNIRGPVTRVADRASQKMADIKSERELSRQDTNGSTDNTREMSRV